MRIYYVRTIVGTLVRFEVRHGCARPFTPERLKLGLLVGWQVNKNNSPVCSTSILRRRQKNVINCTALSNNQLRISWTKNYAQLVFFLQKHFILRLLTDLKPIVLDLEPIVLDRSRVGNQLGNLSTRVTVLRPSLVGCEVTLVATIGVRIKL